MTLFDKNGKGLAHHFCQKLWIFKKALFRIFSSLETVYDPCLIKICFCRSFNEMWKNAPFWQKWQGVSTSLCQKIMNFQKGPFPYLFIFRNLLWPMSNQNMLLQIIQWNVKNAPFWKKMARVSPSFWLKLMKFQKGPFYISFHLYQMFMTPVY